MSIQFVELILRFRVQTLACYLARITTLMLNSELDQLLADEADAFADEPSCAKSERSLGIAGLLGLTLSSRASASRASSVLPLAFNAAVKFCSVSS